MIRSAPGSGTLDAQRVALFRIYAYYRVLISAILVALLFFEAAELGLHYQNLAYYQSTLVSYLGLNLFSAILLISGPTPRPHHVLATIILDIAAIHLLLLFGSGITGGLANLMIISVAAGNILITGRQGFFLAALAALASLALAGWEVSYLRSSGEPILRAGLLGILYFGAAFLLQNISRRLVRSEALAIERAQSLAELEQINHQIIQRMRTGILVTDLSGHVRLANAAAIELLKGADAEPMLQQLPITLQLQLEAWVRFPYRRSAPFQANPTLPQIQASFTRFDQTPIEQILIFLEDISKVAQQAQQMKLASLGRLTAGIAHEIRNPLGAISHAAQLLAESEQRHAADLKMTDIIVRHCKRMNAIIENVLLLSRRGSANAQLLNLADWLKDFLENYAHTGKPAEIAVVMEAGPFLAAFDPSQLEQVLSNLCDNGLRYSEQHTGQRKLTLRLGSVEAGTRSYIEIQDFGPGMPAERQESVFEPFFTTEKTGTGLGLYLARELCEANQAHLALIQSDQTGCAGCCFRITFAHQQKIL